MERSTNLKQPSPPLKGLAELHPQKIRSLPKRRRPMSIAKMIAAHPDVAGDANEPLALAVRHALFCSAMCTSCADACLAEKMAHEMRQCIRACLDCADVCEATARVATRRTGSNEIVLCEALQLCVTACDVCAEECARHDHEHCRICAEMCRECARDCRAALEAM